MTEESATREVTSSELFLSIMIGAVTILMVSSSAGPAIVKPLLLDGSLMGEGRFAIIYDGYETVGDDNAPSIVAVGSSIILAAMNGTCMQEESIVDNSQFYNFAMSGGKPYSEMIQIPALIESAPDIVMLEVGPNSLYGWNASKVHPSIADYNEFRFQLMSMAMSQRHVGDWYDVLDENDLAFFETSLIGKTDAWSEYSRDAVEEYLRREIDDVTNALDRDSYSYVPPINSDEWLNKQRKDFVLFIDEYDKRREKNFLKTFPEMEDFYNSCKKII